jgi:hypothetical protein
VTQVYAGVAEAHAGIAGGEQHLCLSLHALHLPSPRMHTPQCRSDLLRSDENTRS